MGRPVCKVCHKKPVRIVETTKAGRIKYGTICEGCKSRKSKGLSGPCGDQKIGGKHAKKYKQYRKSICEQCGYVPKYAGELDVDHIDGNHLNHDPSNLQTLCANCHRRKTLESKDYLKRPCEPVGNMSVQQELIH